MPFSPEVRAKVIEAIGKKAPSIGKCPVCGQMDKFLLGDGLVRMEVVDTPFQQTGSMSVFDVSRFPFAVVSRVAAHVPLICDNCGNTYLLNINVLGVDQEMFGLTSESPPGNPEVPPPDTPEGALGEGGGASHGRRHPRQATRRATSDATVARLVVHPNASRRGG
jgi:hypothetical protein